MKSLYEVLVKTNIKTKDNFTFDEEINDYKLVKENDYIHVEWDDPNEEDRMVCNGIVESNSFKSKSIQFEFALIYDNKTIDTEISLDYSSVKENNQTCRYCSLEEYKLVNEMAKKHNFKL